MIFTMKNACALNYRINLISFLFKLSTRTEHTNWTDWFIEILYKRMDRYQNVLPKSRFWKLFTCFSWRKNGPMNLSLASLSDCCTLSRKRERLEARGSSPWRKAIYPTSVQTLLSPKLALWMVLFLEYILIHCMLCCLRSITRMI